MTITISEFLMVFVFCLLCGTLGYKYGYDAGLEDGRKTEGGAE